MDAVNLLPLEHKIKAGKRSTPADNLDSRKTLRTGGLAALAVVVLLGALYGYQRSVINSKKSALAKDQASLAEIKPKADAIKAAQASAAARLSVISNVTSSRMNWDRALNDFARIVPTDSFLTSLSFDAPVQTAAIVTPVAIPTTTTSTDSTTDTSTAAPTAMAIYCPELRRFQLGIEGPLWDVRGGCAVRRAWAARKSIGARGAGVRLPGASEPGEGAPGSLRLFSSSYFFRISSISCSYFCLLIAVPSYSEVGRRCSKSPRGRLYWAVVNCRSLIYTTTVSVRIQAMC